MGEREKSKLQFYHDFPIIIPLSTTEMLEPIFFILVIQAVKLVGFRSAENSITDESTDTGSD